jgi:hypothetical protein
MRADHKLLAGVFLVCFANLLLEVMITRLFSATMFYHFTFLAVALALFGVAASGVYVFVAGDRLTEDLRGQLARASRLFAAGAVVALAYAMANPIDVIIVTGTNQVPQFTARQIWQLIFLVGVTAVPFFHGGLVVSLALTRLRHDTGRIYAYDLAGAAAAALVTGVVVSLVGGPTAVLIAAAVALAAAALFDGRRWWLVACGAAVVAINLAVPVIRVPTTKGVKQEATRFEAWNAFSRVTVDDTATIKIDASAATHIENLGSLTPGAFRTEISALAHAMFDPPAARVAIIGPGGGRDVLHALSAGATDVTGIEVNPIIADTIMRGVYRTASGGLYDDPRVHIVVDDGRSFIRRSTERYDIVQASLVDTWAATAAGAFALTENALYTVEAFRDYLDHTTDRGAVTMTRWHSGGGGETARLLILAAAALEARGVAPGEVRRHILYAVSPRAGLGTMIAKRLPITPEELARVEAAAAAAHFDVVVSPRSPADQPLARYLDGGAHGALVEGAAEELRPPTDDRPFFFYFKKLPQLLRPTAMMNDPGLWIALSLGLVMSLAIAFIIAPLVIHRLRSRAPSLRPAGPPAGPLAAPGTRLATLSYFGLVGLSFMTIEIALLQRFTLFLGHPSYSLLVILFSLLLSTAAGAHASTRFAVDRLGRVMLVGGIALAVLGTAGALLLGDALHALIGLGLPVRIAITAALVAPSGIAMGLMIPSVVRVLGAVGSPLVPWGWGVNGATSVIGTVIATVIAIYGGFTATLLVGAAGYLAAGLLGARVASAHAAAAEAPPAG